MGIVVVAGLAASLLGSLVAVLPLPGTRRPAAIVTRAALTVLVVALGLFLAGEDAYLSDGRSTWAAHAQWQPFYVVALVVGVGAAVVGVLAVRRPRLVGWLPLVAVITVTVDCVVLASTLE